MNTQGRTNNWFTANMVMWFQKFLDSVSSQINELVRPRVDSPVSLPRRRSCESLAKARYKNDSEDKFRSRSASMPGRPRTVRQRGFEEQYSQESPFSRAGTRLGMYKVVICCHRTKWQPI